MFFIGITMALALAQTLSFMSSMPEKYMALNSLGIGFSGFVSLFIYLILIVSFDDSQEYPRVLTYYFL